MAEATPLRDQVQSTLGDSYTLERELAGGGMAHVFVAEEKALGRKIVVKVLPLDATAAVSVERFKREIQVAARLQHPHIVPLLSAGEINGLPFYTMPFVKGESLRVRLARSGELSVNEALHCLRDVASALAYAHGEGVVHRDIKPDNVIVSGGVAVVTDFGVSKAIDMAASAGQEDSAGITSVGVALGTPAYMAPEQASADPHVDHRADIYSFGCLAYELLSGSSPFAGRPPQQMLAAHVTEQPESIARRRPNISPALAALVMKCLEKRAGDRPQSADELLSTLDAVGTPSGGMAPTGERIVAVRRKPAAWIIAAVASAVLAGAATVFWIRSNQMHPFSVGETTPIAVSPDLERTPAISPDGKLVAYVGRTAAGDRIFVRQIDGGRASLLTGELEGDYGCPRWSPDGSRISFCAGEGIYVIAALTGGAPKRIIDAGGSHSWSGDGQQIIYTDDNALWAGPVNGGVAKVIRKGWFLHSPVLSPDGRFVAYAEGRPPTFTNVSVSAIWTIPVGGGRAQRISDSTHVNLSPVWAPDGRSILYISDRGGVRDVYQQKVDSRAQEVGVPARLTTALNSYNISLAADGSRLAYDVIRNYSNIFEVPIGPGTARISSGRQITRENQHIETLNLSHDGKWLAYDSDRGGNFDIHKLRLDGGDPVQLTTNSATEFAPSWSPDDKEIAFHSTRNGNRDIFVANAEGGGQKQVTSGPDQDFLPTWSPDGKQISFAREILGQVNYVVVDRRDDGRWSAPRILGNSGESLQAGKQEWSPDGKLLGYTHRDGLKVVQRDGTGTRLLADTKLLGAEVLSFAWSRDGSKVYVFAGQWEGRGAIFEVPLSGSRPRPVLVDEPNVGFGRWFFATDGKRLFYTRANWEADVWVMDLKR